MANPSTRRGQLLREVTSLADIILETHTEFGKLSGRLAAEQDKIARLQAQITEKDNMVKALQEQKRMESENDVELASLQRAVAQLTARKHDFVRHTKSARVERERLKEEAKVTYFMRLGALTEAQSVASLIASTECRSPRFEVAAPPLVADTVWSSDALALFNDFDTLWKRISTHEERVRDLVDSALALKGLNIPPRPVVKPTAPPADGSPAVADTGASVSNNLVNGPIARASHTMYAYFDFDVVLADVRTALDSVHELQSDLQTMLNRLPSSRIDAALSPEADGVETNGVENMLGERRIDEDSSSEGSETTQVLRTLGTLLHQNLQMQYALLSALVPSAEGAETGDMTESEAAIMGPGY